MLYFITERGMTPVYGPELADNVGHRQSDQLAAWLATPGIITIFPGTLLIHRKSLVRAADINTDENVKLNRLSMRLGALISN